MEEREINISPMFKWFTKRVDKKDKKGKKMRKTRLLWEREFKTVQRGLDEKQVVDFVNDLVAQYGASLDPLLETTATNAEQLATSIKMTAQQEAETEAERIINQAKQEAQEIKLSAEIATEAKLATEKEAEDILSTVERKTEIIEAEAKQRTLLYLLRAREEIEKQIREDYKRAYSRLSSSLQDLMSEGQNIEVELKNKRTTLRESKSFELKEYEAALLETSEEAVPPLETLATEERVEQPTELKEEAVEEKVEELVQLEKEAPEGGVEQPTELKEEAVEEKVEELVQLEKEAPEEGIEQPVQLQEEAVEEKVEELVQLEKEAPEEGIEQPTELKEEAVEEKVEEPTKLQEEATVSEPVEETTEELLEQPPLEEIPGREETGSTQLKPGDNQTLYVGEVELAIGIPVELKMVSKFYNYLQTIPDIKILRTTGSWDKGTTITVVADKPTPLISEISEVPDVKVIPELSQNDSSEKGTSSSRLRGGGKGITTRIKLTLKEA